LSFTADAGDVCAQNTDNIHTFTVIVADAHGCAGQTFKKINVVNPYTNSGDVVVCHKVSVRGGSTTQLLNVSPSTAATHLAHGDYLGNCPVFTGTKGNAPAVTEEVLEQNVTIYPNPTMGVFILELSFINEGASIMITDVQGKFVAMQSIAKDAVPTATFDLSSVARGIYMIQVRDGSLNYRTKIVVQ
jgi:hypothetical protein